MFDSQRCLIQDVQHVSGKDHDRCLQTGDRTVTSVRFVDNIDGLEGEEELAKLAERLDKASTAYGMEIIAEKTKLMTNNTGGINTKIKVNEQKLETVTSFLYSAVEITQRLFFCHQKLFPLLCRIKRVYNSSQTEYTL